MLMREADSPLGPGASLGALPRAALQAMLAAGREALEWRRILAKTGDNLVGEVLRHEAGFYLLDHYPKGDVFDPESHAQWYYHAHDTRNRAGEHGHFHTFLRGGGMPDGILPAPLPGLAPPVDARDRVCHLIAISMDRSGWPIGLFTTNRWVTAETWYAAHDVAAMLAGFDLRLNRPCWPVNRFLSAMLVLFRPQIAELLQQRDERLQAWQRQHPGVDAYEDRRLEVVSQIDVSVEAQVRLLDERLQA